MQPQPPHVEVHEPPQAGTADADSTSPRAADVSDPGPARRPSRRRSLLAAEGAVLPVLLAVVCVAFAVWPTTSDVFTTSANLRGLLINQAVVLLAAVAVVPSISAGLYDLSIGANIGASAIAAEGAARAGLSLPLILAVALGTGLVIGLANGLLISFAKINSLIATLGTSTIIAALVSWYTDGLTISAPLPEALVNTVNGEAWGLPRVIVLVLIVAVILWFLMEQTPLGRAFEALGSNPSAARLVGLNVRALWIGSMALTGLVAGLAALVLVSQNGSAAPANGPGYTLVALSAVFLGSTAIRPGRFNVSGAVVAVLLVAVIVNGLTLAGAEPWVSPLFNGVALLAAVGVSIAVRGKTLGSEAV